jgi:hypothetical protein
MTATDDVGTDDLAAWFRISVWTVQRHLIKEGIKSTGRGAHGVKLWPRRAALDTLNARADDIESKAC